MRFLEAASAVLFFAATIVLGATSPALSWDLTGEVTDPSGHVIGPSVLPSVSIGGAAALKAAGVGGNAFSEHWVALLAWVVTLLKVCLIPPWAVPLPSRY
jgi:hypothetical protein